MDDVEPLLHLRLVLKDGGLAFSRRCEERVEVELIELALAGDCKKFVGHLVREESHLRKGAIGVPSVGARLGELLLRSLLIGVGPVEDLLFDELTRSQRLEWSA